MKLCSKTQQIAPFNKIFSWKHSPKPLQQDASRHATRPDHQKVDPLANPAYAHGNTYFK